MTANVTNLSTPPATDEQPSGRPIPQGDNALLTTGEAEEEYNIKRRQWENWRQRWGVDPAYGYTPQR